MMTQPIQMFESLTSETTPAGRKDTVKAGFTIADRHMIELRARYARAEFVANALGDALLWIGRQYGRLVVGIKSDLKELPKSQDAEVALTSCNEICFSRRKPSFF